jgi:prophage antirepressor-like protein
MQIQKSFKFYNVTLDVFGSAENPLFIGSHVGQILGYVNPRKALLDHVTEKYITRYDALGQESLRGIRGFIHPETKLINEMGLYELVFSSKLPIAEKFRDWVFSEVLPSIRKTGSYTHDDLIHNQFVIKNERDLHYKVVQYIRRFYPDVLTSAFLGELQTSPDKRIDGYKKGYTGGSPDLIIMEPSKDHNMMCIEFKTPNGKGRISDKQILMKTRLQNRGIYTLISDDYDEIITEIIEYMRERRICCVHCSRKFKTEASKNQHLKYFHRDKDLNISPQT